MNKNNYKKKKRKDIIKIIEKKNKIKEKGKKRRQKR